jgi:transcriptional regulator with XRE-family HTH domain
MKSFENDPRYNELILLIGERIKDLRKKSGMSYIEMAEKIGLSRNGYNNIELAKSNFQFFTLLRILSYHKIDFFDFIDSLRQ